MNDAAPQRMPAWAIAAGIALLAIAAGLLRIRSYDFWWHLTAGEQILRSGSIPRADDFSFTSRGAAWIDHEWLFQVILALAWRAQAWGVFVLKAACAAGVATIGFLSLRRSGAAAAAALLVVSLALVGLRSRLAERPEMISLVMVAAVAALGMDLIRRPARAGIRLLTLCVITALWANLHAAALAAPVILSALTIGALLEMALVPSGRQQARSAAAVTALAALLIGASLMLNPYGWRILTVPGAIASALEPANIVNPEWGPPTLRAMPLFFIAAGAALLLGARQAARRTAGTLPRLALLLFITALAGTSVRQVGFFFAVLPMALEIPPAMPRGVRAPRWLAGAGCAAAAIWMLLAPPAGAGVGVGLQPDRFPEKAADFIAASLPEARLYNDTAFGGYLIHRGYPQRRVFIDGRNEVHAPLIREISESLDDGRRWQALLSRYEVDAAIVSYRDEAIASRDAVTGAASLGSWSSLHFPRPLWALVYWDDVAMVFVRRDGPHGRIAESLEYRHIQPELLRLRRGDLPPGASIDDLQAEIQRKLTGDPDCGLARALSALYGGGQTSPQR